MTPYVDLIGTVAAVITTLCWLPQIVKIVRERDTTSISLGTNAALASGIVLWLIYGLLLGAWPVILSNVVSFLFIATIVGLKLRYG